MNHVDLAAKTTLFLGVLGLGIAAGTTLGLTQLQTSCIQAGTLPAPGTQIEPTILNNNPCWQGARTLQQASNATGAIGGLLVLTGGVVDTYQDRLREALA